MSKKRYGTPEERFLEKVLATFRREEPDDWTRARKDLLRTFSRKTSAASGFAPAEELTEAGFIGDIMIEDACVSMVMHDADQGLRKEETGFTLPGLAVAWEMRPTLISLDSASKDAAAKALEDGRTLTLKVDAVLSLMPACLFCDTRWLGAYDDFAELGIDALFIYPSTNPDTKECLLIIVGYDDAAKEAFSSQLILHGKTLGDALNHTLLLSKRYINVLSSEAAMSCGLMVRDSAAHPLALCSPALLDAAGAVLYGILSGEAATAHAGKNLVTLKILSEAPKASSSTDYAIVNFNEDGRGDAVDTLYDTIEHPTTPEIDESSDEFAALAESYAQENEVLKARLAEEKGKNDQMAYNLKQAAAASKAAKEADGAQAARAAVLESMDIPQTPAEALALAKAAFPDRLIVLESAHKSAAEFVKGSTSEVWAALRSMAMVLHPIIFEGKTNDIEAAFSSNCPFEMTTREAGPAKKNRAISKLRSFPYKGKMVDMAPHIKGHSSKKGESLRIHFYADRDEERLVIGHCGEHLETIMTPKI